MRTKMGLIFRSAKNKRPLRLLKKESKLSFSLSIGAGGESRTLVLSLGRTHNSRYTTPAYPYYTTLQFYRFVNFMLLAKLVKLIIKGRKFHFDRSVIDLSIFFGN